jgi:hypothetical protein
VTGKHGLESFRDHSRGWPTWLSGP